MKVNGNHNLPDMESKACSDLSCEEKPGGGGLLGTENPGGAETCALEMAVNHNKSKVIKSNQIK